MARTATHPVQSAVAMPPSRSSSTEQATEEVIVTGTIVDLNSMIAEAAYYKAESRGFVAGHEMDDWLEAEREVLNNLPAAEA